LPSGLPSLLWLLLIYLAFNVSTKFWTGKFDFHRYICIVSFTFPLY
jgi:hypothetical protein